MLLDKTDSRNVDNLVLYEISNAHALWAVPHWYSRCATRSQMSLAERYKCYLRNVRIQEALLIAETALERGARARQDVR